MTPNIQNARQLFEDLESTKKYSETEMRIRRVLIRQFLEETKLLIELRK